MAGTRSSGRKPKASTIVERNRKMGVEPSSLKGIPQAPEHLTEEQRIRMAAGCAIVKRSRINRKIR